jgi:hypothetical protein
VNAGLERVYEKTVFFLMKVAAFWAVAGVYFYHHQGDNGGSKHL